MEKTGKDFQEQVEKLDIRFWDHHECSICGYMTKYVFSNGKVFFDAGCDCNSFPNDVTERSWDEIAEFFNRQTHPNTVKKFHEFWKFEVPQMS